MQKNAENQDSLYKIPSLGRDSLTRRVRNPFGVVHFWGSKSWINRSPILTIEKHNLVKFASHPILGTGCPEQIQTSKMSRCCLGPTSHIWGCSKPSKGSNSQLAIDEATKTSLNKISPTSTFPTWWELAPLSCLHSHITLGPSPLLRRPKKFGQPTRGSVRIRSYISSQTYKQLHKQDH